MCFYFMSAGTICSDFVAPKNSLSLFADEMILYIENLKDSTRKLLELINEFGKVAGHKINTEICFISIH